MVDKNLFLHNLAVVSILKNEGPYLKEWLDYHLLAGVEHFYLYDNDSTDNQAEVATPYVEAGLVDYIPFPGKAMLFPAYEDAVKRFKFQCRYMAIIDGDEFVYPKVDMGGGVLSKLSMKFYRMTRTRAACQFIGNVSVQTGKKRRIIQKASWKDLYAALRKIGTCRPIKKILTLEEIAG